MSFLKNKCCHLVSLTLSLQASDAGTELSSEATIKLKKELAAKETENQFLAQQVDRLECDNSQLQRENSQLQRENSQLQRENDELKVRLCAHGPESAPASLKRSQETQESHTSFASAEDNWGLADESQEFNQPYLAKAPKLD